jgi:hypothetical protein
MTGLRVNFLSSASRAGDDPVLEDGGNSFSESELWQPNVSVHEPADPVNVVWGHDLGWFLEAADRTRVRCEALRKRSPKTVQSARTRAPLESFL